jgi:hypothetical protein
MGRSRGRGKGGRERERERETEPPISFGLPSPCDLAYSPHCQLHLQFFYSVATALCILDFFYMKKPETENLNLNLASSSLSSVRGPSGW